MKAIVICFTILLLSVSSVMSKSLKTKGKCVRLNINSAKSVRLIINPAKAVRLGN